MRRLSGTAWISALLVFMSVGTMPAQDRARTEEHQQLVAGLRDRLLLDLADRYCDEQLARRDLTPLESEVLINEKIRTQMARAIQAQGDQRVPAWDTAQQLAGTFLSQQPGHPRLALIRIQMALARLAEAKLIAAETRIGLTDDARRQRGLDQLRTARRELESTARDLEEALPRAPEQASADGLLTNSEIHAILANVRFQIGIANLQRAAFYPEGDQVNRIDALMEVIEWLKTTVSQVDPDHPLSQAARIRLAEAYRLLGQQSLAEQMLDGLASVVLDRENEEAYWRERMANAIAAQAPQTIEQCLERIATSTLAEPETQLSSIEGMLALARLDASRQDLWRQNAATAITRLESEHGTYWSRLAERMLVSGSGVASTMNSASSQGGNRSFELVARVGDVAMRESRWMDAMPAFESAAQEAIAVQAWADAFSLRLKYAQAAEQLGQFDAASAALLAIVRQQPQNAAAPATHLRAAWYVAQAAVKDPTRKEAFRQLLTDHLRDWPGDATCPLARLWLARLQLAAGETSEAVENYLQIPRDAPQIADAASDLRSAIVSLQQLASFDAVRQERTVGRVQSLLVPRERMHESSRVDVFLLQAIAPLVARGGQLSAEEMAERAEATLQIEGAAQSDWYALQVALAAAFLADAPAEQGRVAEMIRVLEQQPAALRWLGQLLRLRNQSLRSPQIEQWQLCVARQLVKLAGDDEESASWQLQVATILYDNGKFSEAVEAARPLAKRSPRRSDIQWMLARALKQSNADSQECLTQWRLAASLLKSHTDEWFEAKYEVAQALFDLGQKTEAAQLLRYVQAVPPGWENSSLKGKFEALLEQCVRE